MRLYVVSHLNAKATQLATGWDLREDSASDSQPFSTGKINGAHARKRGSVSAGFLLSVEQMSSVKLLLTPGSKAHETAAELVVSAAIPKTPEILDWPADF